MNVDRRSFFLGLGCLLSGLAVTSGAAFAQDKDLSVESSKPIRPPATRPPKNRMQTSLVALGPSRLSIGKPIRFQVRTNQSGYGQVYIVNASGSVVLLAENFKLKANSPIDLPKAGLTIRATAPAGTTEVIFLATSDPFVGFAGGGVTTTPTELHLSGSTLQQELQARLSGTSQRRWSLSRLKVRVIA